MSRRKQNEPYHTNELAAKRKKGEAGEGVSSMNRMDVEWRIDEKARLLQAIERDGGKDDWESIAKTVMTRSVEQVKKYMEWMMGKTDDNPVHTSSKEESLLQKWIQTTEELRSEKDDIDGTCIPQLSPESEDKEPHIQRTPVSPRALHQDNTTRNVCSVSRSTCSYPGHTCSCSHLREPHNTVESNAMLVARDAGDCDKLYGSQRELLDMVSEQGETVGKLACDVSKLTAFNSQVMTVLEQINSRLDNLSAQMKGGLTGVPIIIQAPPRTTIIHQPVETSILDRPVNTQSVMATSQCEGVSAVPHSSWPLMKTVSSQVPLRVVQTHAEPSVRVPKTSPGISEELLNPRVSPVCRTLVYDKVGHRPTPRKNPETTVNPQPNHPCTPGSSFTKTVLSGNHAPAAFTCRLPTSMCSEGSGELSQVSVPVSETLIPVNASQTIHYKPSSLGQCTPSSTSHLCCHRTNSTRCEFCPVSGKATSHPDVMVSRRDPSCTTTSSSNTSPPQMNSIDSGSKDVTRRDSQPEASGHARPETKRNDSLMEQPEPEEDAEQPQCYKELRVMADDETAPDMAKIGGKADVLLPMSLFSKFLQTAAGRPNILALRLAEGLFGYDVLVTSTPNGIGNKAALNPHILEAIRDEILSRFAVGRSPVERRDLWRQCHTAIAQMCKRARSSTIKKLNLRRSFDQTGEPTHTEGKPEHPFESEYTGSETSLSDREETLFYAGFRDIHTESHDWFPTDRDSDITVVHIPSDLRCSEVRTDVSVVGDPSNACPDQSNLPNTDSHFVDVKTASSVEEVAIGGDEQIRIPKLRYLEALNRSNQATIFAVRLAELLFGHEVLETSTVTGSAGTAKLDSRIMNAIHADVVKRFLTNKEHDIRCLVWKKCQNSIATKCKMLRYTKPLNKCDDNAAVNDCVESS